MLFFFLKYRPVQLILISLDTAYLINLFVVRYEYTSRVCAGDFLSTKTINAVYLQDQGSSLLASAWIIAGELVVGIVLAIRYWV